jgi:hypothetical protein
MGSKIYLLLLIGEFIICEIFITDRILFMCVELLRLVPQSILSFAQLIDPWNVMNVYVCMH